MKNIFYRKGMEINKTKQCVAPHFHSKWKKMCYVVTPFLFLFLAMHWSLFTLRKPLVLTFNGDLVLICNNVPFKL